MSKESKKCFYNHMVSQPSDVRVIPGCNNDVDVHMPMGPVLEWF